MQSMLATLLIAMLHAAVLFGLASGGGSKAQAQASGSTRPMILVVSQKRLLNDSASALSIQVQSDALRDEIGASLRARREALQAEELELTKLRDDGTLDQDSFDMRVETFKDKVRILKRDTKAARERLQEAVLTARRQLQQEAQSVLLQIMTERGAMVMLDKEDVVISGTSIEVTQEAIDRLDAAAPSIDVTLPGE